MVFGERTCRGCRQPFNYGTRNPPEPSAAEIAEALRAAGHAGPGPHAPAPPPSQAPNRGAPAAPAPHPRSIPSGAPVRDAPALAGLETGRFEQVGAVLADDIPGFIDSSLYAAFTPKHVDVAPVSGLDPGRADDVGAVRVAAVPGLEATGRDQVGAVPTEDVPGLFHSDFLRAPDLALAPGTIEGLEASPRAARTPAGAKAGRRGKGTDELPAITCQCGTIHRLPRCPSCGTRHRGADD
ncbi:MAG: hypothetical protein IT383_08495 [Deltaproteobacteria bacterium]|nr:hypothetical protein [Deltaproteobacteria bacterium]